MINWITEIGNSAGGDPDKRLEWLPEEFESEEKKSDTLLYIGCLLSYLVRDSAETSYLILKHAGIDFLISKDEGCCGVYLYDAGLLDLAEKLFRENAARLEKLGVKRIITPCAGCYRCFKRYYPEVLGKENFRIEVLHKLIKDKKLKLKKKGGELTYHDPCRLGRKGGLYDEVIVTSCPFCTFNPRYTSRKKEINREVGYITDVVMEHIERE